MKCKLIKDILRYPKIDCYALHSSTTRINRFFEKDLFSCVTQSDLSGVPLILIMLIIILKYKWKRCTKKKCCKQCGQVKFMGTMTKWPIQKHTEHNKTRSIQRHNRH